MCVIMRDKGRVVLFQQACNFIDQLVAFAPGVTVLRTQHLGGNRVIGVSSGHKQIGAIEYGRGILAQRDFPVPVTVCPVPARAFATRQSPVGPVRPAVGWAEIIHAG